MKLRISIVRIYDFPEEINEDADGPVEIPSMEELHDILMDSVVGETDIIFEIEAKDGRIFKYFPKEVIDLKVEEEK